MLIHRAAHCHQGRSSTHVGTNVCMQVLLDCCVYQCMHAGAIGLLCVLSTYVLMVVSTRNFGNGLITKCELAAM